MSISFDRAAEYYDETRGYPPEVAAAIGDAIFAEVGAGPDTRFLEIGVGTGRIALPVAARGGIYTGVDISQRMMERLRDKLAELERRTGHAPRISLYEADMLSLPFADHSFDVVIAAHVFHLVADPLRAAQEALRVLQPAGVLLICGDVTVENTSQDSLTVRGHWREIVGELYGRVPNSREAATRVLEHLRLSDSTMRVDDARPVRWDFTVTPLEELEMIRRRLWSDTWRLPDQVYAVCFDRLTEWCANTYGDRMHEPQMASAEFVLRAVRRQAHG